MKPSVSEFTSQWRNALAALLAVALTLAPGGPALAATADGTSWSTAIPLTGSYSNTLAGSNAGSYQFYRINYPGQNDVGTITFYFGPSDPATANAFGVNVYQGITLLATEKGTSAIPGNQQVSFQSPTAGTLIAQVYNFSPGVAVSYQLNLSGLVSPSVPATATATPTPSTPPIQAVSGTLVGSPGGAYASLTVPYTAGAAQSVQVAWWSNTPNAQSGLWVAAYQNGNKIGDVHVSDQATPGSFPFFFNSAASGPVLVQLGDYTAGATINYTLTP